MIRNYIKIALRNIKRYKGYSFINIAGLAIGMTCFILILAYIQFELNYDRFHIKVDQIHRVITPSYFSRNSFTEYNIKTPEVLASILISEFPEVANATRLFKPFTDKSILQVENRVFFENGLFADSNFLSIFTFPLLRGDKKNALVAPNTIVITEKIAKKLFGNEDPTGKLVTYRDTYGHYDLNVTGILKDIPPNSHLNFDYLISVATLESDKRWAYMFNAWNIRNFITYVELTENFSKNEIEPKFPAFLERHEVDPESYQLFLQPVKDIHLRSQIRGEVSTRNEIKYVYLFLSIALVILSIACVNFMNLATARSSTRSREIGVRKVVGASRLQLFKQFIGESLLITFIALGLALIIIEILWPRFTSLMGIDMRINYLQNPILLILVISTAIFVGVVSGSYPAILLSALRPVKVFREFASSGKKGSMMRNVLVVAQFTASIILIVGTTVIFGQLNFIKNQNLGYNREHVVILPMQEQETYKKSQAIKTELLQYPEVVGVSVSGGLPTNIRSHYGGTKFQNENNEWIELDVRSDYVDYDFLNVFEIALLHGRNFSKEFDDSNKAVIVNETTMRKMGWKDPVGKKFLKWGQELKVIGVVKDFYFASLHTRIEPMILELGRGKNIAARIKPENVEKTIGIFRRVFEKNTKTQPFDFRFLDDDFNALYRREQKTGQFFGYFSMLAIFVSCLGLLGLVSFTVERRTKEIGVRKVLGATVPRIVSLLTKDFIKLVIIANMISWPVAYYAMSRWLQNFAYRINIGLWSFILSGLFALTFAAITVSFQTIRAALSNPVDSLRYE